MLEVREQSMNAAEVFWLWLIAWLEHRWLQAKIRVALWRARRVCQKRVRHDWAYLCCYKPERMSESYTRQRAKLACKTCYAVTLATIHFVAEGEQVKWSVQVDD